MDYPTTQPSSSVSPRPLGTDGAWRAVQDAEAIAGWCNRHCAPASAEWQEAQAQLLAAWETYTAAASAQLTAARERWERAS